jgi:hypothetical protein
MNQVTRDEAIYAESVRALEQQARSFDGARGRAGLILAASGIGSSVAGDAATRDGIGVAGILAIIGTVVCALSCLVALWPRAQALRFANSAIDLRTHSEGDSDQKFLGRLAWANDGNHTTNAKRLESIMRWLWFACLSFGVAIFLWLLELALS